MKKENIKADVTRLQKAKKGRIVYEVSVMSINESVEGETLEDKIERLVSNGEDGDEGVGSIYTERKDGILPAYDIRTDRMEVALDAMDRAHRWDLAKRKGGIEDREKALKDLNEKNKEPEKSPGNVTDKPSQQEADN